MRLRFLSRSADAGNGGSGGGNNSGGAGGNAGARPSGEAAVSLALAANNRNPVRIAKNMQKEIDRLRGLLDQQLPHGAVVLKGDEAKAWAAYQALGKPEDLAKVVSERDTLATKLADADARTARHAAVEQGAAALGWNLTALRAVADDKQLTLSMREVEVDDGKGAKVKKSLPHVVRKDDKGAESYELLDAVVQRDHAAYLPMLTAASGAAGGAASGAGGSGGGSTAGGTAAGTGPAYPPQGAGGTAPKGDVYARIREQAKEQQKTASTVNPIDALLNPAARAAKG